MTLEKLRESVFGYRNFPRYKRGSDLGPLAPEASVLTTELVRPHLRENIIFIYPQNINIPESMQKIEHSILLPCK